MNSKETEIELLKSILFDYASCSYAFDILKPENFSNPISAEIYTSMLGLLNEGKEVNIATLTEYSDRHEEPLFKMATDAFTATHAKTYTDSIMNSYYKRTALMELAKTLDFAKQREATPDTIRQQIEDIAYFLSKRATSKGLQSLPDIKDATLKQLDGVVERKTSGVCTGFKDMDEMGFSFRPGTLNVIGARPSMGKSALALDIAEKCGEPVAFFSLEMEATEQFERMISKRIGFTNTELRNPERLREAMKNIADTASQACLKKIWINDSPSVSPIQIRMQCKRLQAKEGLGLVVVDYMGYMTENKKFENRRVEMGHFSRSLKEIAKELNVPILALCQLNRGCEDRTDKRPMLSDLRETGDIEQDAHMVWFIYREAVYNDDASPKLAEVLIRKNRSGRIGCVKLTFDKKYTTFKDYEDPAEFTREGWMPD